MSSDMGSVPAPKTLEWYRPICCSCCCCRRPELGLGLYVLSRHSAHREQLGISRSLALGLRR